ncbi:MAG TPA: Imm44 family immunity protein [Tepidisphaeraceae bacterium]|jgi:hypothetical protein|nr:Imm44 family immunity protein [Tepidisphaeraceae bacterium]
MELWLSGEVEGDVSEPLRQARNKVKKSIAPKLAADYGPDIVSWDLITILRPEIPDGWGEVTRYHRKDQSTEFRLIIDYEAFRAASAEKQVQMLVESILRSLDLFPLLKVKDFDIDRFRRDIVEAAITAGFMPVSPSLP